MLYRDSWVQVDLDALKHNVSIIKERSCKKLIAVIKANGYGCGDMMVAKTALLYGADMLAVSSLEEALSLRNEGIQGEILILGYVNPKFASILKENDLTTTVVSKKWAEEFIGNHATGCKVHLKIDTGMNRIGLKNIEECKEVLSLLVLNGVLVEGLFTHMACADAESTDETDLQIERFVNIQKELNYDFKWVHLSNSDATMHYNENIGNAVRCGLAMYGISDFNSALKPVMSLKCRISHCKKIKAGEKVGYGWSYTANQDEWIATVPIGYADGWWRANQGRVAMVNNKECEFIGRICMDQCMLRVQEGTTIGDIVELFGTQLPVTRVAKELNTIPYEIMTALTDRLTRIYLQNDKEVKTVNSRFDCFEE